MTEWSMTTARRDAVFESWRLRGEVRAEDPGAPEGWMADAICVRSAVDFHQPSHTTFALALCERCPARLDCLTAATVEERGIPVVSRVGVRGGLPAWERRRSPFVRPRPECGTDAGFAAHHRNGEATCPRCRDAHNREQQFRNPTARREARARYRAKRAKETA